MTEKRYDPDVVFSLNIEPEEALEALLGRAGTSDEDWEMDAEAEAEV